MVHSLTSAEVCFRCSRSWKRHLDWAGWESQAVGHSRSTMARRDIQSILKPIGQDSKLVERKLSPYQHEGSVGRIGVQWQTVASWEALPSTTGINAMLRAARHVSAADANANVGQKQRQRSCCRCMGGLVDGQLSVVKLMRWLDCTPMPLSMQSRKACGGSRQSD